MFLLCRKLKNVVYRFDRVICRSKSLRRSESHVLYCHKLYFWLVLFIVCSYMPVVFSESKKQGGRVGCYLLDEHFVFSLGWQLVCFLFLVSGALRGNAKIMDVHVLMEAGASGQATPHVLSPVGVGYSTEKERALIQRKSVNSFRLLNV